MRGDSRCFSAQTELDASLEQQQCSSVNLQAHEMLSSHTHSSNSKASPPHPACPSYSQVGVKREHCDLHLCRSGAGEGGTQPKRPETHLKSKKVSRRKSTGTEFKKNKSVLQERCQHSATTLGSLFFQEAIFIRFEYFLYISVFSPRVFCCCCCCSPPPSPAPNTLLPCVQLARTTGWKDWLGYCMAFRL